MIKKVFFIYLDKTDDGKVFYVGKGLLKRTQLINRNKYWISIAAKYGFNREIIFATLEEDFAFQLEIELIKKYKTFEADWEDESGWGANFTAGGMISSATSGLFGSKHPHYGKNHSEETKKKISQSNTGKLLSKETRQKISIANSGANNYWFGVKGENHPAYGIVCSSEKRAKISKSNSGKADKNPHSKLNYFQVLEIREKYKTGNFFQKDLAKEYGVSRQMIGLITRNIFWKI